MGKHNKTKKNKKTGGKVIASGGYGCVFNPGLKCKGSSTREKNKISKLMTEKHAIQEYEEINNIKEKLNSIPNYGDYFLIKDITLCKPDKLTASDLLSYSNKCTALPKDNISKTNINSRLDDLMSLNIPNGGLPVDDYIYSDGSFLKMYNVHNKLVELLKNGILPMNDKHIYHSDIKDSNVLIDDNNGVNKLKARLIDWGLSTEYQPGITVTFPRNWRNRPLQFNVPFSVVIFTDAFYEKYTKYLKDDGLTDEISLKPFVIDYLNFWMKERGAGHYKFINEIMFMLNSENITSVSEESKAAIIETEITMPIIVDYIVDVLVHFTKYKKDGSLNLREYLNEVYIKIVDIWGFMNVYFPMVELLSNNYFSLKQNEMKIYKQLQFMFNEYLYTPRHEPINIKEFLNDLKVLGNLIHIVLYGKKNSTVSITLDNDKQKKSNKTFKRNDSYKTTKTTKTPKSTQSSTLFKRKQLEKRFKNPFFLSLKSNKK